MGKTRTFIAVNISTVVKREAERLIGRLQAAGANVNWVEGENMHLTLKFLGDVPDVELPQVCKAVGRAVQGKPSRTITCQGAGAFPRNDRPRTVWLGVRDGAEELAELQAAIEDAMADLGFPREARRFHPHLTLGRVREGGPTQRELAKLLQKNEAFEAGTANIDEVIVYASYLDKAGPTYQVVGRVPLVG